jgi:hypothetical protein
LTSSLFYLDKAAQEPSPLHTQDSGIIERKIEITKGIKIVMLIRATVYKVLSWFSPQLTLTAVLQSGYCYITWFIGESEVLLSPRV